MRCEACNGSQYVTLILDDENETEKLNMATNNDVRATNNKTPFTEPIKLPVSDQTYEAIRGSFCAICLISFNESNYSLKNVSNENNISKCVTRGADLNRTTGQDIENGLNSNENEINGEQTQLGGKPNVQNSEESKEMDSNGVTHQLNQDIHDASSIDFKCECLPTATIKDSNVVRYPCPGQHYFHSVCLHKWLQTITSAVIRPPRLHRSIEQSIELYQSSVRSQALLNPEIFLSNSNSGVRYNESALTLDDARRTRTILMMSNPERAMVNCITCPYCRAPPMLVDLPFQTSNAKLCTEEEN